MSSRLLAHGRIRLSGAILFCAVAYANASAPSDTVSAQGKNSPASILFQNMSHLMQTASRPSKFFFGPTSRVLNSMEVSLSGGSSFGVEESGGLLARLGLGLGGVAEIEFSTTQVVNQITGKETRFPSRTFKVNLMPARFSAHPFVPNIAMQLRTTSWGAIIERKNSIALTVEENYASHYADQRLDGISLQTRFTTLYLVAGKEGKLGGIHLGMSLTDVRTKGGGQWIFDEIEYRYDYYPIAEIQKNILKPFGGLLLNANESTQVMAEVGIVPSYRYNVTRRNIDITQAWVGIAGVRFFMARWLSWDVGVRYLSTYDGIADADINIGLNVILPIKSSFK